MSTYCARVNQATDRSQEECVQTTSVSTSIEAASTKGCRQIVQRKHFAKNHKTSKVFSLKSFPPVMSGVQVL